MVIYGLNPQVEAMKKSYHTACKEEKLAASRETNSKLESNNPEAQKKLQEKVEKCQQEMQKVQMCLKAEYFLLYRRIDLQMFSTCLFCRVFTFQTKERYEKSLEELNKLTPQYMENMEQVFEQWQQFEDKRIRFFREVLLEVKQHLDLSANHRQDGTASNRTLWHLSFWVPQSDMIKKIISNVIFVDFRQSTTHWKTQFLLLMLKRTWSGSGLIKAQACRWTGPSLR